KYCSITDQIPVSIWASVPANTRKIDMPRSATVSFSEPSAAISGTWTARRGLSMLPDLQRACELPEEAALFLDFGGGSVHLEEDRAGRVEPEHAEDGFVGGHELQRHRFAPQENRRLHQFPRAFFIHRV